MRPCMKSVYMPEMQNGDWLLFPDSGRSCQIESDASACVRTHQAVALRCPCGVNRAQVRRDGGAGRVIHHTFSPLHFVLSAITCRTCVAPSLPDIYIARHVIGWHCVNETMLILDDEASSICQALDSGAYSLAGACDFNGIAASTCRTFYTWANRMEHTADEARAESCSADYMFRGSMFHRRIECSAVVDDIPRVKLRIFNVP